MGTVLFTTRAGHSNFECATGEVRPMMPTYLANEPGRQAAYVTDPCGALPHVGRTAWELFRRRPGRDTPTRERIAGAVRPIIMPTYSANEPGKPVKSIRDRCRSHPNVGYAVWGGLVAPRVVHVLDVSFYYIGLVASMVYLRSPFMNWTEMRSERLGALWGELLSYRDECPLAGSDRPNHPVTV